MAGLDLRGADADGLDARAARLEALPLTDPTTRRLRGTCVGFVRALAQAERGRRAAAEGGPDMPGAEALLDRIGEAVRRADRLGTACREGLDDGSRVR